WIGSASPLRIPTCSRATCWRATTARKRCAPISRATASCCRRRAESIGGDVPPIDCAALRRSCSGLRRFAAYLRVHVREGAGRVVLPRPDMQLVERRQAVAVGRAGEAEQVVLERGRAL